jgi:CRISPR/Cas system-associated exonuclease Cas4 (RecB family)
MLQNQSIQSLRTGKHFSASALKTYLTCPKKFAFQYVIGAEPEFRPSALILGKAVHEALAVHHAGLKDGKPVPASEIQQQFDATFDSHLAGPIPIHYRENGDADGLRVAGHALVGVYLANSEFRSEILAVEHGWRADLVDPRTGELSDVALVGVFDLVERDEDGQIVIADTKTAAKRWSVSQADLDLQMSVYAEAACQAGLVPEDTDVHVRLDVLVKLKREPVLERLHTVRGPIQRAIARMIAWDGLKAIESGSAFYRNPGWACDGCQFRRQCGV